MMMPEFLGSTTVSERGQVVIPQEARTTLGLKAGEKLLVFKVDEGAIVLTKSSAFEKMAKKMTERQEEMSKIIKENK